MRGDLSEMSAADACRDLASRGETGVLSVDGPDGPARLVLDDGELVAAVSPALRARLGDRLVGAGLLDGAALAAALGRQGEPAPPSRLGVLLVERGLAGHDAVRVFAQEQLLDALFEVAGWRYGTFEFARGDGVDVPEAPAVTVRLTVDDALVEVARRRREWEELAALIPDLEAVPWSRGRGGSEAASLEPDEVTVLEQVDGARSIRRLAHDLGYGEFETARIIHGLTRLGVLDVRLPEDEVGAALDEAFAYFSGPAPAEEGGPEPLEPAPAADEPPTDTPATHTPATPTPAAHTPPAATPATHTPAADTPGTDTPVRGAEVPEVPAPAEASPPAPAEASPPAPASPTTSERVPASGADVSELLRELSRLAVDEPPATPADRRRPPPAPPARPAADEGKRKKRGLFGWGG
jgi:hypothetical protein